MMTALRVEGIAGSKIVGLFPKARLEKMLHKWTWLGYFSNKYVFVATFETNLLLRILYKTKSVQV